MQEIVPFDFQGNKVRVIKDEQGEPWWVAVDVCRALELVDASVAMRKLDDDEKTTLCLTPGHIEQGLSDNSIGTKLNLVNEPGLYRLILTSRRPEAKAFSRWVTHEVLPTIRKTGSYTTPTPTRPTLRDVAQRNREIADLAQSYSTLYRVMGLRAPARQAAMVTVLRARHGIELDQIAPSPAPSSARIRPSRIGWYHLRSLGAPWDAMRSRSTGYSKAWGCRRARGNTGSRPTRQTDCGSG